MHAPLSLLLDKAQRAIRRRATVRSTSNLATLQAGVLFMLDSPSGAGFSDVVRTLKTTAPRLSELVNRMQETGLIMRVANPTDGRAQSLVLTSASQKARRAAVEALVALDDLMTQGFKPAEIAVVERWLRSVQTRCDDLETVLERAAA